MWSKQVFEFSAPSQASGKLHLSGTVWHVWHVWHVWQVSCQKSSFLHFLSEFLFSHNRIITFIIYILVRPSISVPKPEALNEWIYLKSNFIRMMICIFVYEESFKRIKRPGMTEMGGNEAATIDGNQVSTSKN